VSEAARATFQRVQAERDRQADAIIDSLDAFQKAKAARLRDELRRIAAVPPGEEDGLVEGR
jgi:hypothetical protein